MKIRTTGAEAGFEPIPGYVLREKLGSGGYGDVWLADAPGGLKKAIKLVHGTIDDERASHELRSLQRIRQVNHPFILSLERIEVIHGQLIIVTELAQGTLLDRFTEFRQRGFVGIPRDRLLSYLRDAADGLDFLCQQHDLQHLDVKPGNLLLIADRVKVADFGLIKDVQSKSLSIMRGLTPTYAAPEMFDGRPGRFSDQYSLAIVYQELLTGTLPFRGRTTAQLANEHLHKAPNLESIPVNERPLLSKALSKKPQLRFSDCREFITALEQVPRQMEAEPKKERAKPIAKARSVDLIPNDRDKAPHRPDTHSVKSQPIEMADAESPGFARENRSVNILPYPETVEFERVLGATPPAEVGSATKPEGRPLAASRRTLVIGIGETGAETLLATRQEVADENKTYADFSNVRWLLLDTDQITINMASDCSRASHLPRQAVQLMHLKPPTYYRQHQTAQFPQLSRRWVYNIPRSLKTEGVRPLGMLAYLDHASACYLSIGNTMLELLENESQNESSEAITVFIAASAHGGTGGAIANEIGFLVRQVAAELSVDVEIELLLTCAAPQPGNSNGMEIGSAMACLMEINHYFRSDGLHPSIENIPPSKAVDRPPFDFVNLIYGGQFGYRRDWDRAIHQCSEYITASIGSGLGERILKLRKLNAERWKQISDREWTDWLGTSNVRSVQFNNEIDSRTMAERNCLWAIQQWIDLLGAQSGDEPNQQRNARGTDAKKHESIDFMVSDLFRSHRWTAQAWVMRCMNTLLPNNSTTSAVPKDADAASEKGTAENNADLTQEQRIDIEHICDLLALDTDEGFESAAKLMLSERDLLMRWLSQTWLRETSGWEWMPDLFQCLINKFTVNANSLSTVATKLGEKHDQLLDELYQNNQTATLELDKELHTIALETRFHSMASRILSRLATHIHHLKNLWEVESARLRNELIEMRFQLADRLDLRIDAIGLPRDFCEAMANQFASSSRSQFIRDAMTGIALHRIGCCWGIDQSTLGIDDWIAVSESPLDSLIEVVGEHYRRRLPSKNSKDGVRYCDDEQESQADVPSTQSLLEQSSSKTTPPESSRNSGATSQFTAPVSDRLQTCSTGILVSDGEEAKENSASNSLLSEFDRSRPYLVEFGGGIRNFLVVPNDPDMQMDQLWVSQAGQRSALILSSVNTVDTRIVSVGEQLILTEIVDRLWMPSQELWNLAERLLARVDVDWDAIH